MWDRKVNIGAKLLFTLVASAASITYYVSDNIRDKSEAEKVSIARRRGTYEGFVEGLRFSLGTKHLLRTTVRDNCQISGTRPYAVFQNANDSISAHHLGMRGTPVFILGGPYRAPLSVSECEPRAQPVEF